MKYLKTIILAASAAMMGLTACTGDQALPPLNKPAGLGTQELGNGTWESPMAVYQAALGTVPHDDQGYDMSEAWVTGYIVGWVNTDISTTDVTIAGVLGVPATFKTNLLIASGPDVTDFTTMATVQLPSGAVRNALNLADHPENLKQQVTIYGTVGSKYCGAYGVRSVTDYNWGDKGNEPDPNMILPAGSLKVWDATLTTDATAFTFDQGTPGTPGFETWKHSATYGIVATGGVSGSTAIATDAWAVSKVVDLSNYVSPRMLIHWAGNFFTNSENFSQMTRTCVREVGGEWQDVEVPYVPSGSAWTFINSGYVVLDDFAGKQIEIGFNYTSTPQISGTLEIDKVTVTGVFAN